MQGFVLVLLLRLHFRLYRDALGRGAIENTFFQSMRSLYCWALKARSSWVCSMPTRLITPFPPFKSLVTQHSRFYLTTACSKNNSVKRVGAEHHQAIVSCYANAGKRRKLLRGPHIDQSNSYRVS